MQRSKLVALVDYEAVTKQVITLAYYVSYVLVRNGRHLVGPLSMALMLFHEHGSSLSAR